jgi:hypothetical protein
VRKTSSTIQRGAHFVEAIQQPDKVNFTDGREVLGETKGFIQNALNKSSSPGECVRSV